MSMDITVLKAGMDNYMYLLESGGLAAVVDPADPEVVLRALQRGGNALRMALVTHHHADHCAGCPALKSATGCRIVGPDDSRIPALDGPVTEGSVLSLAGLPVRVLAVPGHTRSHVAYYVPDAGAVFTGDAMFAGGCGRLFEGTPAEMWSSLLKIRSLPEDTLVYCGHEYTLENLEFAASLEPGNAAVAARLQAVKECVAAGRPTVPSRLGEEKATNPFLRVDSRAMRSAASLPGGSPVEVLAEIRRRKDLW